MNACVAFLTVYSILVLGGLTLAPVISVSAAGRFYSFHEQAFVSSLLEQGVSPNVVADAFISQEISENGKALLAFLGWDESGIASWQRDALRERVASAGAGAGIFLGCLLFLGILIFLRKRRGVYDQAEAVLNRFMDGDFSSHLPCGREGEPYQMFALVEKLAAMLQAQREAEKNSKEFVKNTISDISHQLKTPLAALAVYQEIIEGEPDNVNAVREFSVKMKTSLNRMEHLIQQMLKMARFDTGNITFERRECRIAEVISAAVSELTARAEMEGKRIQMEGDPEAELACDMGWTAEAVGNIVKNGLDHTKERGVVRIAWSRTPAAVKITISDDGEGIPPEEIHHIFKRFYRSRNTLSAQGAGLGLPLAKAMIEGQGGMISVRSRPGRDTEFTITFLTKL